eukprot:TRINITY_DN11775_c0_g1_i2.p1 TRINITY_DN11775_c0_g1~~TRINITY_DN11775_c0_g1_i2.p1  ORF type:complete len:250 (+),score=76.19 TRINITY_DN11775_c0_g1_i2:75-752(+)
MCIRDSLWTAYLNLEQVYGTEKSLLKVFERSLAANDQKKVYMKMIGICRRADKRELAADLLKVLTKKFKNSSRSWVFYLENIAELAKASGNTGEIKAALSRALQSLPKRKHLFVLTQYAILQFRNGDVEAGRTTFEAILTNYPKRMDVWSVYLDMEVKHGKEQEAVRNLFERALSLTLKPKKMKLLFKKYLVYENKYGTPETVEAVKAKATEYVQSVLGTGESTA